MCVCVFVHLSISGRWDVWLSLLFSDVFPTFYSQPDTSFKCPPKVYCDQPCSQECDILYEHFPLFFSEEQTIKHLFFHNVDYSSSAIAELRGCSKYTISAYYMFLRDVLHIPNRKKQLIETYLDCSLFKSSIYLYIAINAMTWMMELIIVSFKLGFSSSTRLLSPLSPSSLIWALSYHYSSLKNEHVKAQKYYV